MMCCVKRYFLLSILKLLAFKFIECLLVSVLGDKESQSSQSAFSVPINILYTVIMSPLIHPLSKVKLHPEVFNLFSYKCFSTSLIILSTCLWTPSEVAISFTLERPQCQLILKKQLLVPYSKYHSLTPQSYPTIVLNIPFLREVWESCDKAIPATYGILYSLWPRSVRFWPWNAVQKLHFCASWWPPLSNLQIYADYLAHFVSC